MVCNAADEKLLVEEMLSVRRKEVEIAAAPYLRWMRVQMNTLQKEYVRCAHECLLEWGEIDPKEATNCIKHCPDPARNAAKIYDNEMANFHDKLARSLKVCKDRFQIVKFYSSSSNSAMKDFELCADMVVADTVNMMPQFADKLKARLSAED